MGVVGPQNRCIQIGTGASPILVEYPKVTSEFGFRRGGTVTDKATKRKTLADFPDVAAQWHPTKNGRLRTLARYPVPSSTKVVQLFQLDKED